MTQQDKRLFSGAATKIDASKAKLDGMADVSRSLEGRAAGVSVQNVSGTFGTAPKIRVRGATSIYGSSKPLWVVDGVIMEDVTEVDADNLSSGDAATLISSAIAGLNADDIESFQILKDGSATSIYGARAMGGVIVVTTKKGKAGSNRISYTGEYTMRLRPSYSQFNIMNSQEQMGIYKEMAADGLFSFSRTLRASTSGVYGKMYNLLHTYDTTNGRFGIDHNDDAINAYLREAEMRNTNWFKELFSNSISMNHSISMSSGTDKAQYYTSFSFMDDPGWAEQSKVRRLTYSINANYNISKKVTLNLIGNTAYRKQRAPGSVNQDVDVVSGAVNRNFDINPYSYAINSSRALDPNTFYVRNYAPLNIHHELANNFIDFDVLDLKVQAELKYKPVSKVQLSVLGAYKYSITSQATQIREGSNMAMAYRAMDDATIRNANPWLYLDPDQPNSLKFSVLPKGGFYDETKYRMNSCERQVTTTSSTSGTSSTSTAVWKSTTPSARRATSRVWACSTAWAISPITITITSSMPSRTTTCTTTSTTRTTATFPSSERPTTPGKDAMPPTSPHATRAATASERRARHDGCLRGTYPACGTHMKNRGSRRPSRTP